MRKPIGVITSASLLIAFALNFCVFNPLSSQAQPATPEMQTIVVPKMDLEKGSTPTESSLEEKSIEKRLAPVTAVSGIAEVVGRTLKRKKTKGAIIMLDDLARPGDKLD